MRIAMKIARWVLCFPLAVVACVLAYLGITGVFHHIEHWGTTHMQSEASIVARCVGAAFVFGYVAVAVAPAGKKAVAYASLGVNVLVLSLLIWMGTAEGLGLRGAVMLIAIILGGGVLGAAAWFIPSRLRKGNAIPAE